MADGEVTTTKSGSVVEFDEDLMKLGGAGTENIQAKDIIIPRLTILQSMSPQLNKKKAEYIEGAEVGDFCNVATGDVYREQIEVIPCYFSTAYIEWAKGRTGLAANHGADPSILKRTTKNEIGENLLPNGNIVQENAQWFCLLKDGAQWSRIFIPLKSTNLKHSRKWLTKITNEIIDVNGSPWKPPLFWRLWKLIITDESNDKGSWATFRPDRGDEIVKIDPERKLLNACMRFYEDIKTQAVRGDLSEDDGQTINGTANKDPSNTSTSF